ncbi:unnamed protein product [Arctogadus glacialis]
METYTGTMEFLDWSCHDVACWIESLGYPQYKECFTDNFITGRKLIFVNCRYLPRMGITDFKDMQVIAAHVHALLGTSEVRWTGGLSPTPRDDMAAFLGVKSRTGQGTNGLTYKRFLLDRRRR